MSAVGHTGAGGDDSGELGEDPDHRDLVAKAFDIQNEAKQFGRIIIYHPDHQGEWIQSDRSINREALR